MGVLICLARVLSPVFSSCLLPRRLLFRIEDFSEMSSEESWEATMVLQMQLHLRVLMLLLILTSNGTLPMEQIGEAIGIQKEPIASPFTKPVQFAANPKVSAALAAAATMNATAITGAVADLGAHLVLQQMFYGNMFTDTPLLDG